MRTDALEAALDDLFGPAPAGPPDLQRTAVRRAMTSGVSIIAGGPGTGKTHTVARLLAVAHRLAAGEGRTLDVALAAPTGKAAQTDEGRGAGRGAPAWSTGARSARRWPGPWPPPTPPPSTGCSGGFPGPRFTHDRQNPLPCHLVVIDETSMVSLPLMARLLDGLRPEARLVLVGDPTNWPASRRGRSSVTWSAPAGERAPTTAPRSRHWPGG